MGESVVATYEWLLWMIAIASAGIALIRAGVVSAGRAPGLREKSGVVVFLWILCAFSALTGFVLAAAAVRAGGELTPFRTCPNAQPSCRHPRASKLEAVIKGSRMDLSAKCSEDGMI